MASTDDQPRPDLDAAVDAVLPSLTAVSDDTTAASLRRTRVALAETAPAHGSAGPWRWAAPTAVLTMILLGVSMWWPKPPAGEGPRVVDNDGRRSSARPPAATVRVPLVTMAPAPAAVQPRRMPLPRVRATSVAAVAPVAPRPDPLAALVRAVQRIPEEAWTRTVTGAQVPLSVAEARVPSIDVAPLDMPSLGGASTESISPGEP